MKALRVHGYGPDEPIRLDELPMPQPAAGEVRVRVEASGISFVDLLVARGGYQLRAAPPFVPGSEFSGTVDAIGPGAETTLKVGEPVCGISKGAWSQYLCLKPHRLHPLASASSPIAAAVVPMAYGTALYGLRERGQLQPGETVLVLGAAGGVGQATIQVAKLLGARVIACASTAGKREAAQQAGADVLVDSCGPWKDIVKGIAGAAGVNVVFDTVGGEATEEAFRTLGWGGRHLMVGFAGGSIGQLKTNLPLLKGAALIGVDVRQFNEREARRALALQRECVTWLDEGRIAPFVQQTFSAERIDEAAAMARSRATLGRVVITF